MVLGGCAKEGDTANVDLLNGGREGAVRLRRLEDERVEIAHNEGDGRDGIGSEVGDIRGDITGEDT